MQQPTRSVAVTLGEAYAVPLGLSVAEVEHRLGQPASVFEAPGGYRCISYEMAGQPESDRFRFCFQAGKLAVVASAIG